MEVFALTITKTRTTFGGSGGFLSAPLFLWLVILWRIARRAAGCGGHRWGC